VCDGGTFALSGDVTCTACEPGSFSEAGSSTCETCPPGFACSANLVTAACPPGNFSDSTTEGKCISCPIAHECTGGSDKAECDPGKFQDEPQQAKCKTCPSGRFQTEPASTFCLECSAGGFCTEGSAAPIDCGNPALFCPEGAAVPTPVRAGFYSVVERPDSFMPSGLPTGGRVLFAVDRGRRLDQSGSPSIEPSMEPTPEASLLPSVEPSDVPTAMPTLSTEPTFEIFVAPSLVPSIEPSVEPSLQPTSPLLRTADAEKQCEPGFACSGGVRQACVVDESFAADAGATSCSGCTTCSPGQYITSPCNATRDRVCTSCEGGRFSNGTNSHDCFECHEGYFCPAASVEGIPCGQASLFCAAGSAVPTSVQRGYYSAPLAVPGDFRTSQLPCEAGYQCIAGERVACGNDTFSAQNASSSCTDCSVCAPGKFVEEECSAVFDRVCEDCEPGTFSDAQNSGHCQPCPAGFFCNRGSAEPVACGGASLYCPANSSSPLSVSAGSYGIGGNTSITQTEQVLCEPGFYCSGGVRFPCDPGTFSNDTGSLSCAVCGTCQPGRFVVENCSSLQTGTCENCPSGTYSDEIDGIDCKTCPEGFFCPEASPGPLSCGGLSLYCPPGSSEPQNVRTAYYTTPTFASSRTRTGQQPCEQGFQCIGGQREECPEGTFSSVEQTSCDDCTLCPPGRFTVANCTRVTDTTCEDCAEGTFQDESGKSECKTCPVGQFCLAAAAQPTDCEPGKFQREKGKSSCTVCGPDTFADGLGVATCSDCPAYSTTRGQNGTFCLAECLCEYGPNVKIPSFGLLVDTGLAAEVDNATSVECSCSANEYIDTEALKNFNYDEVCVTCGEGLDCSTFGNKLTTLNLLKGYWRSGPLSGDIRECIAEEACVGGSDATDYCADGHNPASPYCASCEDGYFLDIEDQCNECSPSEANKTVGIITGIVVFFSILLTVSAFKRSVSVSDLWLSKEGVVRKYDQESKGYEIAYSEESSAPWKWFEPAGAPPRSYVETVPSDRVNVEASGTILRDLGEDDDRGVRVYEVKIKLSTPPPQALSPGGSPERVAEAAKYLQNIEEKAMESSERRRLRLQPASAGAREDAPFFRVVRVHHDQILEDSQGVVRRYSSKWSLGIEGIGSSGSMHIDDDDSVYEGEEQGVYLVGEEVKFLVHLSPEGYDLRKAYNARAEGRVSFRLRPRLLFMPIYAVLKPKEIIEHLDVKIRVVLGFFQVYGIMKQSVRLPRGFLRFMDNLQFFELDFFRTLSVGCFIYRQFGYQSNFYDILLGSTLLPIGVLLLLVWLYLYIPAIASWEKKERKRLGMSRSADQRHDLESMSAATDTPSVRSLRGLRSFRSGRRLPEDSDSDAEMRSEDAETATNRSSQRLSQAAYEGVNHTSQKINSSLKVLGTRFLLSLSSLLPKDKATYGYIMLLVLFLVLPAATTNSLFTFLCDSIDTGESFLITDYSLQCFTPTHYNMMAYSAAMVLVYPIGVPCLYGYLLLKYRDVLSLDFGLRMLDRSAQRLKFLWDAYKPSFYYFELIDSVRRLALTALPVVLRFIGNGGEASVSETAATLIVATSFLTVYCYFEPFEEVSDNQLMILSQVGICFLLIVSLVELNGDLSSADERSWNIILILTIVAILGMLVIALIHFNVSLVEVVERIYTNYYDTSETPPLKDNLLLEKAEDAKGRFLSQKRAVQLLLRHSKQSIVLESCLSLNMRASRGDGHALCPENLLAAYEISPREVCNNLMELASFVLSSRASDKDFRWFYDNLLDESVLVWLEEDPDELDSLSEAPAGSPDPRRQGARRKPRRLFQRLFRIARAAKRGVEMEFELAVKELKDHDKAAWRCLERIPVARSFLATKVVNTSSMVQEVRQDADGIGIKAPVESGTETSHTNQRSWVGRPKRRRELDGRHGEDTSPGEEPAPDAEDRRGYDAGQEDDTDEDMSNMLLYLTQLRRYAICSEECFHRKLESIFSNPQDPIWPAQSWKSASNSGLGVVSDDEGDALEDEGDSRILPVQCWLNPIRFEFAPGDDLEADEFVLPRPTAPKKEQPRRRSLYGIAKQVMRGRRSLLAATFRADSPYVSKWPEILSIDALRDRALYSSSEAQTVNSAAILDVLRSSVVFESIADLCAGYQHFIQRIDADPFLSLASVSNRHIPISMHYMTVVIHFLFVPDPKEGGNPLNRQICQVELVLKPVYVLKRDLHHRLTEVLQKERFYKQAADGLRSFEEDAAEKCERSPRKMRGYMLPAELESLKGEDSGSEASSEGKEDERDVP